MIALITAFLCIAIIGVVTVVVPEISDEPEGTETEENSSEDALMDAHDDASVLVNLVPEPASRGRAGVRDEPNLAARPPALRC